MTTVIEAVEAIRRIDNPADLLALYEAVRQQEARLAVRTARSLAVGDVVKFRARTGSTVVGKVVKKNRKTIEVLGGMSNGVFNTRYKVPASMLEPA